MRGLGLHLGIGAAAHAVAPYDPNTVGLSWFFDSAFNVTQSAGAATAWVDKIGGAKTLVNTNTVTYSATGAGDNGPYLQGDGTSSSMTGAWTDVAPAEIFVVAKWNPTAAAHDMFDGATGNQRRAFVDAGGGINMYAGNAVISGTPPNLNSWRVYDFQFNGASSTLLISGVTVIAAGNAGAQNGNGLTLWRYGGGQQNFSDFKLRAIMNVPRILSSGERATHLAGLRANYGAT